MIEIDRGDVIAAAYDADIEESAVREEYESGWGGGTCFGIVCDDFQGFVKFIKELTIRAKDNEECDRDDYVTVDQVDDLCHRLQYNTIGKGMIFYFPGARLTKEN